MNIEMIRAAAERIQGHAFRTPLLNSRFLDQIAGRRVWIKPECLQHTGSFKFRGAYSALSALEPDIRANGVIAFSSGNHAQGVALAAQMHGTSAVIIMPSDAPQLKIDNTRAYGAEVVLYDRATESRDEIGAKLSQERNLTLIKPFDNAQVLAGQGTCGLEIAEDANARGIKNADVIVCCGGGGLTAGIALALEADAPSLRVRPAEPEGFDDVARSLISGQLESNTALSGNICDAIITPQAGEIPFPIMKRLCGPGMAVSEDEALKAMAQAFLRLKIVAEPGGAAALAAALYHPDDIKGDDVIVTISGGNVDPAMFTRALETL
ncbi:threonine ammonia-lyase [Sulfitobacter donghicola]|uniref:Serine/threonine dehydratase n=1 Tax=Sulfitobacter donghicola DSW-25 = KCTC 12864 = JCM 14565 TaxID=1300350 RepID=A0A073IEW1_9RHOB|nr:threonine/serine dehydratase [Sulfitobacter donghicola]KEJ88065.1 serine/threonine dehydratase [Sulfitobacter donghicola DSW-25 = KCTC 12864 = JCM 14565]KIN68716.1 Threonine dehydratase [Sulfitobacter donghicola DSW-25 = KCTC 12864 = JCM 14565]